MFAASAEQIQRIENKTKIFTVFFVKNTHRLVYYFGHKITYNEIASFLN